MGADRQDDPEGLVTLAPVHANVLLALADGERHGYGIMVEVRERTGGKMLLVPGTLYGTIKRIVKEGLIEESAGGSRARPDEGRRYDAERRRYYRITEFGERVLAAEIARLEDVVRTAREKGVSLSSPGNPLG